MTEEKQTAVGIEQDTAKPASTPKVEKSSIQTADKLKATKPQTADSQTKYAVLQVRGLINVNHEVRDTLKMLNLQNQNQAVILEASPVVKGMLKKAKDYITFGEVTEETIKLLKEKRKTTKKYYALHPPRGGFERKGIKKPFTKGGVLGYRGDKINALIQKMV